MPSIVWNLNDGPQHLIVLIEGLYKADAILTYEAESKRTIWSQLTGIGVSEPSTDKPQLDI